MREIHPQEWCIKWVKFRVPLGISTLGEGASEEVCRLPWGFATGYNLEDHGTSGIGKKQSVCGVP